MGISEIVKNAKNRILNIGPKKKRVNKLVKIEEEPKVVLREIFRNSMNKILIKYFEIETNGITEEGYMITYPNYKDDLYLNLTTGDAAYVYYFTSRNEFIFKKFEEIPLTESTSSIGVAAKAGILNDIVEVFIGWDLLEDPYQKFIDDPDGFKKKLDEILRLEKLSTSEIVNEIEKLK